MERITPFMVMDILDKARNIPDAVHMEVGEPDLPPSDAVQEAFVRAIREKRFSYSPACGLWELRERISQHYLDAYGVKVSPERIIITPGTSGAFLIIFALLSQSRKKIALSDPSYPCYKNFSYFMDMDPCFVTVGRDTDYEMRPESLRDIENLGSLMISSPANPTGSICSPETMNGLISLGRERNIRFVSDEIYHGLVYDAKEHTALEFDDNAVVINSFSKYYCMPGIRVGWMILPADLLRPAEILIQNLLIGTNTPAQYAVLEAFDYGHLKSTRDIFRARRDFLMAELEGLFEIDARPQGAFYLWADVSKYSSDSTAFCKELLEKKRVAITPGIDFGSRWTEYVRLAYTRDIEELKKGVARIREFLGRD